MDTSSNNLTHQSSSILVPESGEILPIVSGLADWTKSAGLAPEPSVSLIPEISLGIVITWGSLDFDSGQRLIEKNTHKHDHVLQLIRIDPPSRPFFHESRQKRSVGDVCWGVLFWCSKNRNSSQRFPAATV